MNLPFVRLRSVRTFCRQYANLPGWRFVLCDMRGTYYSKWLYKSYLRDTYALTVARASLSTVLDVLDPEGGYRQTLAANFSRPAAYYPEILMGPLK